nr:MAG TPA: hypothetical protein [Caudoviricetes sp.]
MNHRSPDTRRAFSLVPSFAGWSRLPSTRGPILSGIPLFPRRRSLHGQVARRQERVRRGWL